MTILDFVLLLIFVPALIVGAVKGLIRQAISLVALFAGIYLAWKFSAPFADVLTRQFITGTPPKAGYMNALAFAIILIGALIACSIIGVLLTKIASAATLGGLNRLLGALFAVIETAIILSIFICLFDTLNLKWELVEEQYLFESKIYQGLLHLSEKVFPAIKSLISPA